MPPAINVRADLSAAICFGMNPANQLIISFKVLAAVSAMRFRLLRRSKFAQLIRSQAVICLVEHDHVIRDTVIGFSAEIYQLAVNYLRTGRFVARLRPQAGIESTGINRILLFAERSLNKGTGERPGVAYNFTDILLYPPIHISYVVFKSAVELCLSFECCNNINIQRISVIFRSILFEKAYNAVFKQIAEVVVALCFVF